MLAPVQSPCLLPNCCYLVAQLCKHYYDSMDYSQPGFSVSEISQTRILEFRRVLFRSPSDEMVVFIPFSCLQACQNQSLSNESVLHIRWPKCWSFNFSISPSNEYLGLISFRMNWLDLLAVSPTPQFKSINSSALSFLHSPTLTSMHDHWKNHSLD